MIQFMKMVRMMCGKILLDKIAYSVLRDWNDVKNSDEHLKGHRIVWLGHLERMNVESLKRRL